MYYNCRCCNNNVEVDIDTRGLAYEASGTCNFCKAIINLDLDTNKNIIKDYTKCNTIESVIVSIDDNIPEYMEGILRIGSVEIIRTIPLDELETADELVNNAEFHSEDDLQVYVARKLNVSTDIIEIVY